MAKYSLKPSFKQKLMEIEPFTNSCFIIEMERVENSWVRLSNCSGYKRCFHKASISISLVTISIAPSRNKKKAEATAPSSITL